MIYCQCLNARFSFYIEKSIARCSLNEMCQLLTMCCMWSTTLEKSRGFSGKMVTDSGEYDVYDLIVEI